MSQPLNFCKQIVRQFAASMAIPSFPKQSRQILSHAVDLCNASEKFLLPTGGRLFDDKEFKALDESEPLRLPYPFVAIEYMHDRVTSPRRDGETQVLKRVILAREQGNNIAFMPVWWVESHGIWVPSPEAAFLKDDYLDRPAGLNADGRAAVKLYRADDTVPLSDYEDEAGVLLCFLNALQCVNVSASHTISSAKRASKALAFDSYHVLTVDSGKREERSGMPLDVLHRSPREHLRRGHIRRYESGLKVWVNATVVNPGVGGKVSKDYAVR